MVLSFARPYSNNSDTEDNLEEIHQQKFSVQ